MTNGMAFCQRCSVRVHPAGEDTVAVQVQQFGLPLGASFYLCYPCTRALRDFLRLAPSYELAGVRND